MGLLWTPSICSLFPKQNPRTDHKKQTSFSFTNSTINSAMSYQIHMGPGEQKEISLTCAEIGTYQKRHSTSPNRSRIRFFFRINCFTSETSLHLRESLAFVSSSPYQVSEIFFRVCRQTLAVASQRLSLAPTKDTWLTGFLEALLYRQCQLFWKADANETTCFRLETTKMLERAAEDSLTQAVSKLLAWVSTYHLR